jgi:HEAT repeat protein
VKPTSSSPVHQLVDQPLVVKALAKHAGPAAREAIEGALDDQNLVVRSAAIWGIADSDPIRGIALYEQLATAPGITPLLRQEAQSALSDLRQGRRILRNLW